MKNKLKGYFEDLVLQKHELAKVSYRKLPEKGLYASYKSLSRWLNEKKCIQAQIQLLHQQ